jgi:acyl dehydratase
MKEIADSDDTAILLAGIRRFYGSSPRMSVWYTVTQDSINRFCAAIGDNDWMHVDSERAKHDSPFGACVAPGFWSLSMLPHLVRNAMGGDYPPGTMLAINYGFDRIRFTGPVLIGARVRLAFKLVDVTARERGRFLVKSETTIDVEGRVQPALIAEWMFLLVYPG